VRCVAVDLGHEHPSLPVINDAKVTADKEFAGDCAFDCVLQRVKIRKLMW
jgi:hypothetical protein